MAKRELSQKYNESCLRIFALISLFMEKDAPFKEVIKLFANNQGTISQQSNVILNKYMNTLEIFGIEVKNLKTFIICKKLRSVFP